MIYSYPPSYHLHQGFLKCMDMSASQKELILAIILQYEYDEEAHDEACSMIYNAVILQIPKEQPLKREDFGAAFCFLKVIMSVGFLSQHLPQYSHELLIDKPKEMDIKKAKRNTQQHDIVESYQKKLRETYDTRISTCEALVALVDGLTSTEVLQNRRNLNEINRRVPLFHARLVPVCYAILQPTALLLECISTMKKFQTNPQTALSKFNGKLNYIKYTGTERNIRRFDIVIPGASATNLTAAMVMRAQPRFQSDQGRRILDRAILNRNSRISLCDARPLGEVISCMINCLRPNLGLINFRFSNPHGSAAVARDIISAIGASSQEEWKFSKQDRTTTKKNETTKIMETLMVHKNASHALKNTDGCVICFHKLKTVMFAGVVGAKVWCPQLLPGYSGSTIDEFTEATQTTDKKNLITSIVWCRVLLPPSL